MNLEEIKNIQLHAIHAIENPSWDFQYRGICRWYSEKFHTPLHTVEWDLPPREILCHYYEDLLNDLYTSHEEDSKQRYHELRNEILYPGEMSEHHQEDDDWAASLAQELAEEAAEAMKQATKSIISTKDFLNTENPNIIDDEVNISMDHDK